MSEKHPRKRFVFADGVLRQLNYEREESVTGYKSLPSLFPTDAENSFEVDK